MVKLPPITRMAVGNLPGEGIDFPKDLGTGVIYYVSASEGHDKNDGRTPDTAWRTVGPVNRLTLQPGDSVLFRRGDVFVGQHLILHGIGHPDTGGWITVDAYGAGEDPRFEEGVLNQPAILLPRESGAGGYRIRHLHIRGYLVGIAACGTEEFPLDGLEITDCTLCDCTIEAEMDFHSRLPCGSPLACALFLQYIRYGKIQRLTIDNTDCPVRFCGGQTVFDRLDIRRSHIQGMMLYGVYNRDSYEEIMATDGYVTVENSRILYTGDRATRFGSTGCLLENIHHATVRNIEVGYTVNTLGYFDACAVDWEQSNIACVFEDIYAHDNQGPFVLAMEHPESMGNSRDNVIRGCVSVNNALFGGTESCSFINYSSYNEENQRIRIERCVDIAAPGAVAYVSESKQEAGFADSGRKIFPLILENFTAGVMDVAERFLTGEPEMFLQMEGALVQDGRLVLQAGGQSVTGFFGGDFAVSCWLKGEVAVNFRRSETGDGYLWRFMGDRLECGYMMDGRYTLLRTVAVERQDIAGWVRLRVEICGDRIDTYLDDRWVDTLSDGTFTVGGVALLSTGGVGLVRELYVYRYVASLQKRESFSVEGEALLMDSAHGEFGFFSPETSWIPKNMKVWEYRPFRAGWGEIQDYGATLTRQDFALDVTNYTHLQVVLVNFTRLPEMWIEFTGDGETWHCKRFQTACMGRTEHPLWRTLTPPFRPYILDMRDEPAWSGRIVGLRLGFAAGSGHVAVKTVTLCNR